MKKSSIWFLTGVFLLTISCISVYAKSTKQMKGETIEAVSIHPTPETGFIGDPMPYFDGEKMNIFYLADQRLGTQGYHPWALCTTKDFCNYDFSGVVIPYGDNIKKQDNALGTGSVIKDKQGLYHAFYTGHNDTYFPKEAIMHATSRDMKNWEKHEEDTFYADSAYSKDDFRDPYVFYNEEESKYWMLITTRKDNMGVIVLYKSDDLIKWNNEGVLFKNDMGSDANMECPSLIQWNGYWYLTFSDQWPDRVVHYRIANSPKGPFTRPQMDYFDGTGFYAGRLEKADNKMYLIGWNGTKESHQDGNNYNWAGNLVSHQLTQKENGRLCVIPIKTVDERMNNNENVAVKYSSDTVKTKDKMLCFSGADYELASYPKIDGCTKITGKIKINDKTDLFGFSFHVNDKIGILNLVFNKSNQSIGFYNVSTDAISGKNPQSKVAYKFKEGDEIPFTILIDNGVTTLYVNHEVALTARMYLVNNHEWGFFSKNSNVVLQNLQVFK